MNDRNDDPNDKLMGACRAAVEGPFGSWLMQVAPVRTQVQRDGMSFGLVATALRRWSLSRTDVLRLVIGTHGGSYLVSVLLAKGTIAKLQEATQNIRDVLSVIEFPPCEVCVLGAEHADSCLFHLTGQYEIFGQHDDRRNAFAA